MYVTLLTHFLSLSLQVVYQSRKCGFVMLYVTARDNTEVSDWVATLRHGMLSVVCEQSVTTRLSDDVAL